MSPIPGVPASRSATRRQRSGSLSPHWIRWPLVDRSRYPPPTRRWVTVSGSIPVGAALSGTGHIMPSAFSQVKGCFRIHRVVPETSALPTDSCRSSTVHAQRYPQPCHGQVARAAAEGSRSRADRRGDPALRPPCRDCGACGAGPTYPCPSERADLSATALNEGSAEDVDGRPTLTAPDRSG